MSDIKPIKFLLPAIFLLVLGIGNIIVGAFKTDQYQEVLSELYSTTDHKPITAVDKASPLRRIQLTTQSQERTFQRLRAVQGRIEFYKMVSTGGGVFVMISILLMIVAVSIRSHKIKQTFSERPNK